MPSIMFSTGADVTSREGMWRPRAVISGTFTKNNFNTGWSHGSAVIVEVNKYLCMRRSIGTDPRSPKMVEGSDILIN